MRKSFSRQEGNERRESPAKISLRIIPLAGSSVRQALLRCEVSTPPMTALGPQADFTRHLSQVRFTPVVSTGQRNTLS